MYHHSWNGSKSAVFTKRWCCEYIWPRKNLDENELVFCEVGSGRKSGIGRFSLFRTNLQWLLFSVYTRKPIVSLSILRNWNTILAFSQVLLSPQNMIYSAYVPSKSRLLT